jgi:hypothetical protein
LVIPDFPGTPPAEKIYLEQSFQYPYLYTGMIIPILNSLK